MFSNENQSKSSTDFFCEKCDYYTLKKSNFDEHLLTSKHKKSMISNQLPANSSSKSKYTCETCNKIYKDNSGLWRHKQKCRNHTPSNKPDSDNDTNIINTLVNENKTLKEFMIEQNQDFKSLIMELIKKETINNNTINNNNNNNINNTNCNNKSFNLNVFLNEQCKDAMNMSEFVDTIKMQLSDLENFAHLGYADGVSKIFVQGINALEIHKRPIHCSDSKRETLYIKDNDEWIKETDDKPLIKSAIKRVAFKNIKQINEWIKENPECKDPRTKKYDKYNKIVMNAMSGTTVEEQQDNIEKIVKNVTKAVTIDKYALR